MPDTSGPPSPTPSAFYDPDSSSWRMSQGTFLLDSTPCSLTLPGSGTTRSGRLYERPTLAPAIGAPGSLSSPELPTPAANQYEMADVDAYLERRERCKETSDAGNGFGLVLSMAVKMLPTPVAGDASAGGSRNLPGSKAHPGVSLSDVVATGGSTMPRLMPTPAAWDGDRGPDYARMGREASGGDDLVTTIARHLPTPTARDHKDGVPCEAVEENALLGRVAWQLPSDGATTPTPSPATPPSSDDPHPTLWTTDDV